MAKRKAVAGREIRGEMGTIRFEVKIAATGTPAERESVEELVESLTAALSFAAGEHGRRIGSGSVVQSQHPGPWPEDG